MPGALSALVKSRALLAIKVTGKAGRVLSKRALGADGLTSSFWVDSGWREPTEERLSHGEKKSLR